MPFVPAPGIVTLDAIWQQANEIVENTFAYHLAGAITAANLTAMAAAYAAWVSGHTNFFATDCQLNKIYLRDMTSVNAQTLEYNVVPPIVGTAGGSSMPNNVTFALKRQTGLAGRRMRGRVYIIGLTDTMLDSSRQQLTSTWGGNLNTAYNALMAAMLAGPAATEVVYHRALGTGTNVAGYVFSDLYLDSQRRRLPGHNRHR